MYMFTMKVGYNVNLRDHWVYMLYGEIYGEEEAVQKFGKYLF